MTRDSKRRTVDGLATTCGTSSVHVNKFGRPPTAVPHQKLSTPRAMLNNRIGVTSAFQEVSSFGPRGFREGRGT
jgi:hypothetical protein